LRALIWKEAIQIINDPSSMLIAFVLPVIMLFLCGYAVSPDSTKIKVGVVIEDRSPEVESLLAGFTASKYFIPKIAFLGENSEMIWLQDVFADWWLSLLISPAKRELNESRPPIQIIADGSEPTTANTD
jgi:ABC-2 type transport system permease protein